LFFEAIYAVLFFTRSAALQAFFESGKAASVFALLGAARRIFAEMREHFGAFNSLMFIKICEKKAGLLVWIVPY